jgi:prepilin-type N-terminal cleavage/methylation domain-containing protein
MKDDQNESTQLFEEGRERRLPLEDCANRSPRAACPRLCRGMTLIELTISLVLVTAAAVAIAQLVTTTAGQRRLVQQRRIALQEVANRAERVALMPWNETERDMLATWEPSEDLKAALPEVECVAVVTDETDKPAARRIRLVVRASDPSGEAIEHAALTVWKYAENQR